MYHKESGTGNDPFLEGNMLCRWSLDAREFLLWLIYQTRTQCDFFYPQKTYHLERCTHSGNIPAHSALGFCLSRSVRRCPPIFLQRRAVGNRCFHNCVFRPILSPWFGLIDAFPERSSRNSFTISWFNPSGTATIKKQTAGKIKLRVGYFFF